MERLGAEIINKDFSKRVMGFRRGRFGNSLLFEEKDKDLMRIAEEVWVISGCKNFFSRLKKLENYAISVCRRKRISLKYFSVYHQGSHVGEIKEVDRGYLIGRVRPRPDFRGEYPSWAIWYNVFEGVIYG